MRQQDFLKRLLGVTLLAAIMVLVKMLYVEDALHDKLDIQAAKGR